MIENEGGNVEIMSFASPVKELSHKTVSAMGKLPYVMQKSELRPVYQAIGEGMREYFPDIWCWVAAKKVEESDADVVIFDDCRYPNEIETFRGNRTTLAVWLDASTLLRSSRGIIKNGDSPSETALDDYDGFDGHIFQDKDTTPKSMASMVFSWFFYPPPETSNTNTE